MLNFLSDVKQYHLTDITVAILTDVVSTWQPLRVFLSDHRGQGGETSVTETGVWLLAAQKPIKRPGWSNGKFALFSMLATEGRVDVCPQADFSPLTIRGQELLQAGATCRNSAVTFGSHLEIGHGLTDPLHLDCFRYS